jgi:hypothetical protein
MVIVDPVTLKVLSTATPPEPVTGRITWGRVDGRDYVYLAGRDALRRFRYRSGRLALDRSWGPITYRTGAQQPGTGPGVTGDWVVVQTNFLPAPDPLTVTAVSSRDSRKVFRIRPFRSTKGTSFIVSKAALDTTNSTIVTHDTGANQMAALRLDAQRGLSVRWRRTLRSLDFSALVGDAAHRQIVIPDSSRGGDQVVWLDEHSGRELARSATLAKAPAPGNIVSPGFDGRFWYVSSEGKLWALRPRAAAAPAASWAG